MKDLRSIENQVLFNMESLVRLEIRRITSSAFMPQVKFFSGGRGKGRGGGSTPFSVWGGYQHKGSIH